MPTPSPLRCARWIAPFAAAVASLTACSSGGSAPGSGGAGATTMTQIQKPSATGGSTTGTAAGTGGANAGGTGASPAIAPADSGAPGSGGVSAPGTGGAPAGAGGDAGASGGDGLLKNGICYPVCGFPTITDPAGSGYGWERQRSCLVATSPAAAGTTPCSVPAPVAPPVPGDGVQSGPTCFPVCSSATTDPDHDGYGFEHLTACVVSGTAAALGGLPCKTTQPPLTPGNGIQNSMGMCFPLCQAPATAMPDAAGYGFENMRSCVVSTSVAALQGIPCNAPAPPPPPPPPPKPPGTGWIEDYTATMFGQINCAPFGFSDPTNLNGATCVGRGAVQLGGLNNTFFGASGDLSTLWNGAPACTCAGGQNLARCGSPPGCAGQTNCGQCVEIACNGTGKFSFMSDGFTHNEFCKPNTSVVVQLIDTCPHNHPNNTYWCTTARPNHIDISCSAFNSIAAGRPIGEIGSINAYVRPVNCSVGLGPKTF